MKLLGFILMAIGLTVGLIATTTAYLPKLDASLEGQVLNLDAGKDENDQPIATAGTVLTPDMIAQLQAAEVERVKIKSFSFSRWTLWPYFAGSVVTLVAGGLMVKSSTKRDIEASTEAAESGASPAKQIATIEESIAGLRSDLEDIFDEEAKLVTIVDRVGDILGDQVLPFFDMRNTLIGMLGLAGFAGVMDRFSALERSLNRAWSAAADGHAPEAISCLEQAAAIVPEVRQRMEQA